MQTSTSSQVEMEYSNTHPSGPASNKGTILNSWKEIASYLGRGVRTAQRWESELKMPVHRPRAKSRSVVVAMSDEIDAWLRSAPTTELLPKPAASSAHLNSPSEKHAALSREFQELRVAHRAAMQELVSRVRALEQTMKNPIIDAGA